MGEIAAGVYIVGLLAYFIPAFIAFARSHHNRWAIALLNLLLGWTLLGWIAALIWSATSAQAAGEQPRTDPPGGADY